MANQGSSNTEQGIPWDQLIQFANSKKAEEKTTGKPAQLDKQQLAAIAMLIELVKDIEVDDTCKKITTPKFTSETFNQSISGTVIPRSRVICTLPSKNQQFPQEGYGYASGEEIPTFKKAQKAKNFAAMQALNWLQGQGPSSSRGEKRPASVIGESPARTKRRTEDEDNPDGSAPASITGKHPNQTKTEEENNSDGGALTADSSQASDPTPASTAGIQGPTIRERAAKLGVDMDFGIPKYFIERDDEGEDTWKGWPVFRHDGRIPPDTGVVTGVKGRQQAEDLVAQKTLEWLEGEKKSRDKLYEQMLASVPRPT
ncbi:hypothetical protein FIE12Z_8254 [Fusarium flagelliforme]|uniref:DRBM domain-containing protein n=1 Tax=Fusarium flagelliforme TaxID=2675880 RepID=A0A395MHW3_9HYPO|nr:hypothetical protein FIE12Z_8254 [Fusarium flagelliforme]